MVDYKIWKPLSLPYTLGENDQVLTVEKGQLVWKDVKGMDDPSDADEGKWLTVENGQLAWKDLPKELPEYDSSNAKQVLSVDLDGNLLFLDIPVELPEYDSSNAGQVLTVDLDGNLFWTLPKKEIPDITDDDVGKVLTVTPDLTLEYKTFSVITTRYFLGSRSTVQSVIAQPTLINQLFFDKTHINNTDIVEGPPPYVRNSDIFCVGKYKLGRRKYFVEFQISKYRLTNAANANLTLDWYNKSTNSYFETILNTNLGMINTGRFSTFIDATSTDVQIEIRLTTDVSCIVQFDRGLIMITEFD